MSQRTSRPPATRRNFAALLLFGLVGLTGCAKRGMLDMPPSQRLYAELRAVLGTDWPSPEYQRARLRLQQMGPEVDSLLVAIVHDGRIRTSARADALVLLADRGSSLALPTLRSALQSNSETLRSASVLGLNQLGQQSEAARELIRLAAEDRSRTVRLNALQSLDIRDVETIRRVLQMEVDEEVRQVALQLVSLAEARGAPLAVDWRGSLRTASNGVQPQIVFRPVLTDTLTQTAVGDLRIEVPTGRDIPLAASARVVGNVVPAFFSPDGSAVVAESDGEIVVVDIQSRTVRDLGKGISPRLIPFTPNFIFLREVAGGRSRNAEGIEVEYQVLQGSFATPGVEEIGRLTARERPEVRGGESPTRWMVVSEAGDGFVLEGSNMDTFQLPLPVWSPAVQGGEPPPGIPFRD